MEYTNPVIPGFHPDPTVCRVGTDYYLATSSFEYFPGIPLFHSDNLVDWEPIGHALDRESQLPLEESEASGGIFAPTLRYHDGVYYLVSTNRTHGGHFLVTTTDPAGEWSEPTYIDAPGLDPDIFWANETVYFTYAESGVDGRIRQAELDLSSGTLGETSTLRTPDGGVLIEAPHIYNRKGSYYLLLAEGGTHKGHRITVFRSDHPTGPFRACPDNPILSHCGISVASNSLQAAGHGDIVKAHDGTWWVVFLAVRMNGFPGRHLLGRETCLAPVTWEDDWPVINDGQPVEPIMAGIETDLESRPDEPTRWDTTDSFTDETLGPEWNYRRNPRRQDYQLDQGELSLRGRAPSLSAPECTFLGRRLQHHDFEVTVEFSFIPDGQSEAGITFFQNEAHHYDIGIDRSDGDRYVFLRLSAGDLTDRTRQVSIPDGPVTIMVSGSGEKWTFRVRGSDGEDLPLGTVDARYLATEVAGGFTGVFVGCYASGNGQRSSPGATFHSFSYTGKPS